MNSIDSSQKIKRVRASVVCVHQEKLLGFWGDDPLTQKRTFVIPGGEIEAGESPDHAAKRETLEETGYKVFVHTDKCVVENYDFEWNGKIYDCTTCFFGCNLENPKELPRSVNDASYHRGVDWIPVSELFQALSYHNAVRDAVLKLL